jgi:cystathionine beta-lyase
MDESQRSAVAIAEWLVKHQRVGKVFYPGLATHPGSTIHAGQSAGPGAVLSFELESYALTKKLLEEARFAAFAVSLGGVESILSYPAKMSHAAMPPDERAARGITDTLVRLSVGIEDCDDLLQDLEKCLTI